MDLPFNEDDLPEVVVEEKSGNYTYIKVGSWSFCVEDDLDRSPSQLMDDAKAFTAYALYHKKIRPNEDTAQ